MDNALICERNGHVAGVMLGYRLSSQGETPELDGICPTLRPESDLIGRRSGSFYMNSLILYPDERKLGLGKVLLAAAERKAREAQCSCILLEVERGSVPVIQFYRRSGFGLWPCVFGAEKGSPYLVLEKTLSV